MAGVTCRILPFAAAGGPQNMAADEVLLESAVAGVATLRFYAWAEATLSLGYFQAERLRQADERLAHLPYVRRASGGAALVHHHEVTYALALPAGAPWQAREDKPAAWLCRMHRIIAGALGTLGVEAGAVGCESEPFGGFLCFQHLTPGDLTFGPSKVVGSAQRRQRGALLQHGAILLATSPHAPVLPGIRQLTGKQLTHPEIRSAVRLAFTRDTGWVVVEGEWTAEERKRVEELAATKYSQPLWNRKR